MRYNANLVNRNRRGTTTQRSTPLESSSGLNRPDIRQPKNSLRALTGGERVKTIESGVRTHTDQTLEKCIVPQPAEQGSTTHRASTGRARVAETPAFERTRSSLEQIIWHYAVRNRKRKLPQQPSKRSSCLSWPSKGCRNSGVRTHPGHFGTNHLALRSAVHR